MKKNFVFAIIAIFVMSAVHAQTTDTTVAGQDTAVVGNVHAKTKHVRKRKSAVAQQTADTTVAMQDTTAASKPKHIRRRKNAVAQQTADTTVAMQDTTAASKPKHVRKRKSAVAQNTTVASKPAKIKAVAAVKRYDLTHRPIDHFIFQFGYMNWTGGSYPFTLTGFSRQFNAAAMMDYPFKADPHYSLGYGVGYASDNFFLNGKYGDISNTASTTLSLSSNGTGSVSNVKKFKIVCNYFEIPLELRWSANAEQPNKGFRIAVGLKPGWMYNVHSKAKYGDVNGQSATSNYIEKIYSNNFFNTLRCPATLRLGLGFVNIYGSYQLTPLLKSGAGPTLNPVSVGIGLGIM